MTLLIEATLKGYFVIVDHLLENFSIDIDAVGKIRHFGSVVDGATALWCAAGQYIQCYNINFKKIDIQYAVAIKTFLYI